MLSSVARHVPRARHRCLAPPLPSPPRPRAAAGGGALTAAPRRRGRCHSPLNRRPDWTSLYRRPGRGPHPTRIFSLFSSAPLDRGYPLCIPFCPPFIPSQGCGNVLAISETETFCLPGPGLLACAFCPVAHAPTAPHAPRAPTACLLRTFAPSKPPYLPCSCLSLGYCVAVAAVSPGWEARARQAPWTDRGSWARLSTSLNFRFPLWSGHCNKARYRY